MEAGRTMARVEDPVLFFVTSPRTPWRFIPEIKTLDEKFHGRQWNKRTQTAFMEELYNQDYYVGSKNLKDPAFSARDRINRAPKAYGFVKLTPSIGLTDAGKALVKSHRKDEVLLRQLLKFQLPSVYHKPSEGNEATYYVKPFLELLRLIRHFGSLSFDEIQLFGMQLTDYRHFDDICSRIEEFRRQKALNKGKYKKFLKEYQYAEIRRIYRSYLERGDTGTRESENKSAKHFLRTKLSNLRDYTDACFRYLRATNYVLISESGRSLSIPAEKQKAVDYVLENIDRRPCYIDDEKSYEEYLFNPNLPKLYTDNREHLIEVIHSYNTSEPVEDKSMHELRDIEWRLMQSSKENKLKTEVRSIKNYKEFDDIITVFNNLGKDVYYDDPLKFEWNTWRAMTMLDGGKIKANLRFDDNARPLSTAPGNEADIVCDYGDFFVNVEVTMQQGQRQYMSEQEPVSRHVGVQANNSGKPTYCLFIAPKLTDAIIAYAYSAHFTNVKLYGGKVNMIPLSLSVFEKMVADSKKAKYVPEPRHIKAIFDKAKSAAEECARTGKNEEDWYKTVEEIALSWLGVAA